MRTHKKFPQKQQTTSYTNSNLNADNECSELKSAELESDNESIVLVKDYDEAVPLGQTRRSLLYLTNIHTTQEENRVEMYERRKKTRKYMIDKPFEMRTSVSSYCKKHRIALLLPDNKVKFSRIKCNSWTCPDCAKDKAYKTLCLIRDVIRMNDLNYFWTFTLNPALIPHKYLNEKENNTHKYITKLLNNLLTQVRKKLIKDKNIKLRYVWVPEYTKNGIAHIHMVIDQKLNVKEIRKIWTRIGGGQQMKVLKVKSLNGISVYIAKYITKKYDYKFSSKIL